MRVSDRTQLDFLGFDLVLAILLFLFLFTLSKFVLELPIVDDAAKRRIDCSVNLNQIDTCIISLLQSHVERYDA
ncbi:hypothetical protein D3C71_924210 [compost metagenome]